MKISGGTTLGNCATGSPTIVTRPTMTMMETFLNDPQRAATLADAHWLDVNFVLRFHDGDLIAALQFINCALRDQQRATGDVEFYPNAPELTRAEGIIWIWKQRCHSEGSGGRADLSNGCVNLALDRIGGSIGEDQFNFQFSEAFVPVALGGEQFCEVDIGLLGDVVVHLDRIHRRDGG